MIAQDIRDGVRSLARAPGFTLIALVTLALGIGATTAIFSVVDAVLLRPLPYPDSGDIVSLVRVSPAGAREGSFSAADFLDYRRDARSVTALSGYREELMDLTGRHEPVRLVAVETTAAFFDVFRVPPRVGRVYAEASDPPEGPRVVVLADRAWRQHFGEDESVVGSTIRLNGIPMTVIGVMPPGLTHPVAPDLWVLAPREVPTPPLAVEGDLLTNREVGYFQAVARLAPGITAAQAGADLSAIAARVQQEVPNRPPGGSMAVTPLQETIVGDVRLALVTMMSAVGLVLLIACANVAGLLLARGAARRRELAVRAALGASRHRLVVQLLTESVLLAIAGGLLGLLVARWGLDALLAVAPETIPRLSEVALDLRVALFAAATALAVGVLFGIVPAFQGARARVSDALRDGGRGGTARTGTRRVLVVAEVALSLVLLIGAGLMLTSFARLQAVDPGFLVEHVTLVSVPLPQARYERDAQVRFYSSLHERLRADPITRTSAVAFPEPFGGAQASGGYSVEGAPRDRGELPIAQIVSVSPGYFQALGIPLLRGRDLSFADGRDQPRVVIVNRTLAEREWPDEDPIGKRLVFGAATDDTPAWLTVVGVAADSKLRRLDLDPIPTVYMPLGQFTLPLMSVVVRSEAGEAAVIRAVRAAVTALDPHLPIGEVTTVERVLTRVTGQPRFRAFLIGTFAVTALLLAAVGLYGLIAFTVTQRVPEIGVRLALGARPHEVARLVVGQGLRLAAVGVLLGLGASVAAAQLVAEQLYAVSATDPVIFGSLAILLLVIAAVACLVPARRAMRVDPIVALRTE